ncbi:hypothetical protein ARSQ2_02156 [Arsenophonus endosymbiont of Bemisia tabaci Q2]|nr:hypothetical protein ARSQ2_02156 [Arsenophonus endosymbiont of Bemisia tabaci Q2]
MSPGYRSKLFYTPRCVKNDIESEPFEMSL